MKRAPRIPKANREVILSAATLNAPEARCLVTNYYDAQRLRKQGDMQLRHLGDKKDPNVHLPVCLNEWTNQQADLEKDIERSLENYAKNHPVGRWMLAQHGVGPVISAGFLAHLDIEKAPTAGSLWRYSDIDPTVEWKKGEKRPYNVQVKQLCYHLGNCFMKTYNSPESFYGRIYKSKKDLIVARNEAGHYAKRAKVFITASAEVKKKLEQGKLPDGNLDQQARNQAVKIFLSHLHAVMYWHRYGRAPAKPFTIAILGHAHEIKIPHIDMFPGLAEAYYGGSIRLDEAAE